MSNFTRRNRCGDCKWFVPGPRYRDDGDVDSTSLCVASGSKVRRDELNYPCINFSRDRDEERGQDAER